jgi:hypothetical protein
MQQAGAAAAVGQSAMALEAGLGFVMSLVVAVVNLVVANVLAELLEEFWRVPSPVPLHMRCRNRPC